MTHIFPASERLQKITAVALQLRRHLTLGSVPHGLIGLAGVGNPSSDDFEGLRFMQQMGTGFVGDETTYVTGQVIFTDDEEPGVPRVRIVDVVPEGSPQAWGDDQEVVRFRAVLDCWANEYTGAVTEGIDPFSAHAAIAECVWSLVSHFEAMSDAGFLNANAIEGTSDISGVEFHIPLTVTFESYFSKV